MGRMEDEAVGHADFVLSGLFQREGGHLFEGGVAEVFANVHGVVGVAVVEHALGNGGRGVFAVGEDAEFGGAFDEGAVELMPGTASEGDDAEVVVGEKESVSEGLEGVE